MANPILLKRSNITTKVPLVGDLSLGELALNTFDGRLFTKKNNGSDIIVEIGAVTLTGDVTGSGNGAVTTTLANVVTAGSGYKITYDAKGRVTAGAALVSGDITTALGFTPYNATNPNGYTSNLGTVTSVGATGVLSSSGGTTPSISITQATTSTSGYLSSTDWNTFNNKQAALGFTPINATLLGAANGVATLDGSGKVTASQLPAAVSGSMNYQGVWDASTNSPTLVNGTGTKGYYYKVSTAGNTTIDTNTNWTVGDLIVYNGTTWDKIEGGSPDVVSVAGRIGAVVLGAGDIVSGTFAAARMPAYTGDATTTAGSTVLTLANTAVTAGSYGSATQVGTFTTDGKGRLTLAGNVTITPAWASITSKPTTVSGFGITDALTTAATLDSLADTIITTPAANNLLQFNGTNWVNTTIAGAGLQPAGSYLTGNQSISVTGDATGSGTTAITLTLANSGVTAGTYNNVATEVRPFTVDAKGRVTSIGAAVPIAVTFASLSGKPTTVAGYGITDALSASSTIDGGTY